MTLEISTFEILNAAIKTLDDRVTALEATTEDLAAGLKDHVAGIADATSAPALAPVLSGSQRAKAALATCKKEGIDEASSFARRLVRDAANGSVPLSDIAELAALGENPLVASAPPETLTVELTYFKRSGKYYGAGTFEVPGDASLSSIWDKVETMRTVGDLPGLVPSNSGYSYEFAILIHVPGHPNEHPRLLQIPGHPYVD